MKTHLIARSAFLAALLLTVHTVRSAVLYTEDFDYALGSVSQWGASGWNSSSAATTVNPTLEPFKSGDLEVPLVGNQANVTGTSFKNISALPNTNGSTLYISFLAKSDTPETGFAGVKLVNNSNSRSLLIGQLYNKSVWGFSAEGNSQSAQSYSSTVSNRDASLLVVKIEYTSSTSATVSLFVNPSSIDSPGTPSVTQSGILLSQFNQIALVGAGGASMQVDAIRIGTTYADVVTLAIPEPATTTSIILAAVLLVAGTIRILIRRIGQ